jgi:hypothetical protein
MRTTKTLRYLAIATWMVLALTVVAATLLHVASGNPLDLSTAFDWVASIAQVGAFLIVAVQWHEQLALIESLSQRIEALGDREWPQPEVPKHDLLAVEPPRAPKRRPAEPPVRDWT